MENIENPHFCLKCGEILSDKYIDGVNRKVCLDCGWIYYNNPLPTAAAVVFKNDAILLIKRGVEPAVGEWTLPSGFLEMDESPGEGCIRELKEETGLNGRIKDLIGVDNEISSIYGNVIVIAYEVEIISGKLENGGDADDVKFFKIKNIPAIPFASHRRIVDKAIKINNS